ncbi:MAG: TSUP family transporter, partial [Xanthomonadaceae bacterium]|nr:TSUP family transporter [Xanthomonadaceae bacterium]
MHELALQLLAWLFLAALLAGFIDAIAGGGGMVTIPAMLLAGIPPLQVLGTNKLQAVFGSGAASWSYARAGHVDLRGQWPMALGAALGAVGGALLATAMPTDWLRAVLPLLLVAIALYFGVKRGVGELERHRRISPLLFGLLFVPAIGFYDGVFGPGTGSFLML